MKRLLAMILCAVLCLSCFAGCRQATPEAQPTASSAVQDPSQQEETNLTNLHLTDAKNLGFSAFDNQLIAFLRQTGLEDQNFTVSPLSFKAALALAALGAEGKTLDELLAALGYTDLSQVEAWYLTVLDGVDAFDDYFSGDRILDRGDAAYQVVNAVWSNEDLPGEFRETYTAEAQQKLRAQVRSAAADKLAGDINAWVNEQTNGLIPALISDASDSPAVLVNALYLKAGWENPFGKIGEDDFTTPDGGTVTKQFMRVTGKFHYYEDADTQLVVIPLQGGMSMLYVLGDDTDLSAKLAKAEYTRVEVTVPMFDVETSLDHQELCNYLRSVGCTAMFTDDAEFDPMFSEPLYVGDIIQKAKVHIDEEGLEAAAATAIVMRGVTATQPEEPKIFRADHAFTFYVLNDVEAPELLFWGQIVR